MTGDMKTIHSLLTASDEGNDIHMGNDDAAPAAADGSQVAGIEAAGWFMDQSMVLKRVESRVF